MEVQKKYKARIDCVHGFVTENYVKNCSPIKAREEDSKLGVNC